MHYVAHYELTQEDKDGLMALVRHAMELKIELKSIVAPEYFGVSDPAYRTFAGVTIFRDVISYKMFKAPKK